MHKILYSATKIHIIEKIQLPVSWGEESLDKHVCKR